MNEQIKRGSKLIVTMFVDMLTMFVSIALTYLFLKDVISDETALRFWWLLPTSSVLLIATFFFTGVYRTVLRYAGSRFFIQIIASSIVASGLLSAIWFASVYGGNTGGFPRSFFALYAIILCVGTAGSRLTARWFFDRQLNYNRTPALIYGAGAAGYQLYSSLRYGGDFAPIAFIDDNPLLQGRTIQGLKVYGLNKLQKLIETKKIRTILLAMPVIARERRISIIEKLQAFDVSIKTTPSLSDIISGKAHLADLHNLSIEDLMSRPAVQPNESLASQCVFGKSVLVTGAGGSIGSELCRQIIQRNPTTIVLYEMTESALFYVEQELEDRLEKLSSSATVVSILGSVLDVNRLKEVMMKYNVKSVFHAAAYKHVPMLEANPIEGIRNNVIGTKRVAEACVCADVESFVVVSTDKAVRPTNLMGATKRFAELIVHAIVHSKTDMKTCMVRFGNVLGSSGSVVPTFREQIRMGGPVNVTHQDMTRYFMSIPEASQLVLQAGAMATDTEIFVLDMGDPIRIYDLAKRMIKLSGFQVLDDEHPNGDIKIVFTGLRPGEKMFEELSMEDNLEATNHPKIRIAIETRDDVNIIELSNRLQNAIDGNEDDTVFQIVCQAVPEYTPSEQLKSQLPTPEISQLPTPEISQVKDKATIQK